MAKDIINETEDLEDCELITLVNDDGEEKDFLHKVNHISEEA